MRMTTTRSQVAIALALGLVACHRGGDAAVADGSTSDAATTGGTSSATGADSSSTGADTGTVPPPEDGIARVGLRRLTRYEFDNVVRDILLDTSRPASQLLPEDPRTPFDNDYTTQVVSQPLVNGIEVLAKEAAERLVADTSKRDAVVGCTPSGDTDETCMREFVGHFGRLALRRPLAADEIDDFTALGLDFASQGSDFYVGVEVVVRALLQDTEFVYRVEVGTEAPDQPGTFALDRFQLAARMSFFLMGTTPDDALLDAAEAGELDTADGIRDRALALLDDPRAHAHVDRFHSLWMGYAELPHPQDLTNAMRRESAALVERVVFEEQSSWLDLFASQETFINDLLADHYGLPHPAGGEGWVAYGDSGRMGILSHGAFLSVAANVGDTSPTKRGKYIREQLMCQDIPPPPPNVMADNGPDPGVAECKKDRYLVHAVESCAGCHSQMDPIGFGLEQYDRAGQFRTHDIDNEACEIDGEGEIADVGAFNGPAELSQLLIDNALLDGCVTQQAYRFALGRELDAEDMPFVQQLNQDFVAGDHRFDELLMAIVTNPAFGYRREEEG